MRPLHGPQALGRLQVTAEAGMTDTVTLHQAKAHDVGHGGETEDDPPLDTGPFDGLLLPASAIVKDQAAARGIAATYLLQLPIGTVAKPGMTATVVRESDAEDWTREIEVTGVELPADVFVVCTAVDVPLNQ